MNNPERLLSPKRILSATLFSGALALSFAHSAEAAAPIDPIDTTTTSVATPNTGGISGDILCLVDGNTYAIDGPVPIPDNCNDEPAPSDPDVVTPPLDQLPNTGVDLQIGAVGAAMLGAGLVLRDLSHRANS